MTRFLLLFAAVSFGLLVHLFTDPETAQAAQTDTIRFMAATRGVDFDRSGLTWCYSQYFHEGVPNVSYRNALDELPQKGSKPNDCAHSETEKVDLTAYGSTNSLDCVSSFPCSSLYVEITSGEYTFSKCDFIEANLFDLQSGDWKGKQRMLHSNGPLQNTIIAVASDGWYLNSVEIGAVTKDNNCVRISDGKRGWTNYHVHHDFMQPTGSQYCTSSWNDPYLAQRSRNWKKANPDHWVHSLVHTFGTACLVPGPPAADFLLGTNGPMDGTGEKTRQLAAGKIPSITADTCFSGTTWCGTLTVTPPVLLAARKWHLNNRVLVKPPSGGTTDWYNDGNARVYVQDAGNNFDTGGGNVFGCVFPEQTGGGWNYLVYVIAGDAQHQWWWPNGQSGGCGPCPTTKTPEIVTGCIRLGGSNSTAVNPWEVTQETANLWVQDQINGGHWADVVKPALDAVIRPAQNLRDMHSLGITESPSFDSRQW